MNKKILDISEITKIKFRANVNYDLVMFENLPKKKQMELASLKHDPNFYAVLCPKKNGLTMKAIDYDTARLFLKMRKGGRLPDYIYKIDDFVQNKTIIHLVLDNLLEIESPKGYVSGIEAYSIFYNDENRSFRNNKNIVTNLSVNALKYGQNLNLYNPIELSKRLYFYNRIPVSSIWKKELSTKEKVASYLGINVNGSSRTLLNEYWKMTEIPSNQGWFFFYANNQRKTQNSLTTYKLYINPHPKYIGKVFFDIIRIFTKNNISIFKVGNNIHGILRPDKMVAYFSSFNDLEFVSRQLNDVLGELPTHAVPFTALLDKQGLLSWGMDPPHNSKLLSWEGPSWRRWLTNRLASSLIQASNTSCNVEPWEFALQRIKLDGVHPLSWIPDPTVWKNNMLK